MASGSHSPLKDLYFPFMVQGHMLPMADMATLFAARGASSPPRPMPPSSNPSVDNNTFFAHCVFVSLDKNIPQAGAESFVVPGLLHEIRLL